MDVFHCASIYIPSCFLSEPAAAAFGLFLKRTEMEQSPGQMAEQLRWG